MPASRKRAGRPMRASSAARKLISLSIAMEVPLNEATDAVHALRLIGYGLEGQGEEEVGARWRRSPGARASGLTLCRRLCAACTKLRHASNKLPQLIHMLCDLPRKYLNVVL